MRWKKQVRRRWGENIYTGRGRWWLAVTRARASACPSRLPHATRVRGRCSSRFLYLVPSYFLSRMTLCRDASCCAWRLPPLHGRARRGGVVQMKRIDIYT